VGRLESFLPLCRFHVLLRGGGAKEHHQVRPRSLGRERKLAHAVVKIRMRKNDNIQSIDSTLGLWRPFNRRHMYAKRIFKCEDNYIREYRAN
jgi:hypothetical protein